MNWPQRKMCINILIRISLCPKVIITENTKQIYGSAQGQFSLFATKCLKLNFLKPHYKTGTFLK